MIHIRGKKCRIHGFSGVASSTVEYSAFNRLVLGSNPRRPMYSDILVVVGDVTLPITLPSRQAYASRSKWQYYASRISLIHAKVFSGFA